MTNEMIWAAALGILLGAGMILALRGVPTFNQPHVTERIRPYVMSVAGKSSHLSEEVSPIRGAARIFLPLTSVVSRHIQRFSVSTEQLSRRLLHAGLSMNTVEYRMRQVLWAATAVAVAVGVNLVLLTVGRFSLVFLCVSIIAGVLLAVMGSDYALGVRIQKRQRALLREFPALAEMLALAVGAGETALGAFERVGKAAQGLFAEELLLAVQRTRAGDTFVDSLRAMNRRADVAPVARFLEGIEVAVQRGTPLAEVMRAQAADVREASKRELMEAAGKKEIGMMVPLIFGILPLTVVFAVYPGLELLSIGL